MVPDTYNEPELVIVDDKFHCSKCNIATSYSDGYYVCPTCGFKRKNGFEEYVTVPRHAGIAVGDFVSLPPDGSPGIYGYVASITHYPMLEHFCFEVRIDYPEDVEEIWYVNAYGTTPFLIAHYPRKSLTKISNLPKYSYEKANLDALRTYMDSTLEEI